MKNNGFEWGDRSVRNIQSVRKIIQLLAQKVIGVVPYDLTVLDSGGFRTPEQQNAIFKNGFSKCDGYTFKSYHQSGLAIDFVPYVDGKVTWSNKTALYENAKVILQTWDSEMVASGLNGGLFLHWGGFWGAVDLNKDGLLQLDEKLGWDMVHFELNLWKQKNILEFA